MKSNKFALIGDISKDECHKFLQRSGRFVQTCVEVPNVRDNDYLELISQHCHNVVNLCFFAKHDQSDKSIELLRVNPNLEELRIHCRGSLSPDSITMAKLKYLRISGTNINDHDFVTWVKSTSQLCFLSVHIFIEQVPISGFEEAARFCPQLRFFEPPNLINIDHTLSLMMPLCAQIEHIEMYFCTWLTDAGVEAVAKNVKSLKSIQFRLTNGISNACLLSLAEHQHHSLEIFIVYEENTNDHIDTKAVTVFRQKCTKLRVFDWKRTINYVFYHEIVNCIASADRVTTLEMWCVTTSILQSIAQHCTQLQVVDLHGIESLEFCSDELIVNLVKSCTYLHSIVVKHVHCARL